MYEAGFTNERHYSFWNDLIEIADLHEGNVLKGEDGYFYFIDTMPAFRDKSLYLDFNIH